MTFLARIRFAFGIIMVILVVGLLVLYLNSTLSTVHATQAYLGADTTTVGVDYAGQVSAQYISVGQKVTRGQTLFNVTSPSLTTDMANHTVVPSSLPFKLKSNGDIPVNAPSSGIVQTINYQSGSYVPGGSIMAVIYNSKSLYITGKFSLSPPDYARVRDGEIMDVTFPDNSKTQAKVYSVNLQQDGANVVTIVNARLPSGFKPDPVFSIGTPVQASLRLSNNTWWDILTKQAHKLFSPRT
ncbi:MAG TPA: HlyD family efflux transporter periplasmic adaptor subunit [Candidatus Saccharimonadales bacterium]|nr:HlyD family efflux transporter periplasmic adaptor subunit [Candidatus Saccharimonadales bacterium]